MNLDPRIPDGPLEEKWRIWKDNHELVGPAIT
jgi:succinate dehydrogenase / fumarate reductase flavoprotein subunit